MSGQLECVREIDVAAIGSSMTILGIDVGKEYLDCALWGERRASRRVPNTVHGFEQLVKWLNNHKVRKAHACMEATGGWSEDLAYFLQERGHAVSIVNPLQIRAFGQSELSRAKTDKADAALIARFCEAMHPSLWEPPKPAERRLRQLVRRRRALVEMRTQERNRLEAPGGEHVRGSITAHVAALSEQINILDAEIKKTIDQDDDLRGKRDLIESIDGIGKVGSSAILGELPPVDTFQNAKAFTAFAGLCPQIRQSGTSLRSSRTTHIGNRSLRPILYMAAIAAMRCNPVIKAFAARLKGRGKASMEIIVAVMRKLLVLVFGVLKTKRPFDPNYA